MDDIEIIHVYGTVMTLDQEDDFYMYLKVKRMHIYKYTYRQMVRITSDWYFENYINKNIN